ncbi:cation:dicarboxylate symporter family transporter, partial [Klebsiella pneumoniae]|uniref:cation:dicarboxylate symporter family transporter n=1 Tax=Klebsiella pneumoniae TaxID=573 RepID=UPI001953440C
KGQLLIARAGGIFDVQRQRVEIQGLEVNLGVKLPVPGLKASIGYAHLNGRYDADTVPDGKVDTDLDGTNIYMTLATLFLAQAVGAALTIGQYAPIILVAMLTSKGASGVTGAGFITLAATLAAIPNNPVPVAA